MGCWMHFVAQQTIEHKTAHHHVSSWMTGCTLLHSIPVSIWMSVSDLSHFLILRPDQAQFRSARLKALPTIGKLRSPQQRPANSEARPKFRRARRPPSYDGGSNQTKTADIKIVRVEGRSLSHSLPERILDRQPSLTDQRLR